METIWLVLLIVYGSIGALLACAAAVNTLANDGRVRLLGMLSAMVLWPLAIIAFVVKEQRAGGRSHR
jgi:hypothetical protein